MVIKHRKTDQDLARVKAGFHYKPAMNVSKKLVDPSPARWTGVLGARKLSLITSWVNC